MDRHRLTSRVSIWIAVALNAGCAASDPAPAGGGTWTERFTGDGWWMNVHVRSAGDRWAVGGTPTAGAIRHVDAATSSLVSLGVTVPLLNWITEDASGELVVVGNHGTVLRGNPTGTSWALEPTPNQEDLWGVFPLGGGELVAVGGSGRDDAKATVIRRTSAGWAEDPLPTLVRPGVNAFFKVWASSRTDVWVVGQSGAVLHHDGAKWEEKHAGTDRDLIAVWGVAPDRVVMVGGRGNGVVVFWNGTAFRTVDVSPVAGLNGVWMRHRDVVHAVGLYGTVATLDFDSGRVTDIALDTEYDLHAIHGGADGTITAVGGSLAFSNGPYEGTIFDRTLGAAE